VAMTVPPACTASWTAMGPTPPVAPGDEHGVAGLNVQRVKCVVRGDAGQADDGGPLRVDAGRDGGDGGGGQRDVLAEAAGLRTERHAGEDGGDPVADGDALDAGTNGGDGADQVAAEHDRELDAGIMSQT